jgi:oligopeptidase B
MESTPPFAQAIPTSVTEHGDTRIDEFSWLKDKTNPATLAYLEAENAYTEERLAHLGPLREHLFTEIRSRIVETDMSVPVRRGPYWYYSRTVEGLDYPIFCRLPYGGEITPPIILDASASEEIIFDENIAAEGHEFFSVGIASVSPNHHTLALAVDTVGNERHELTFRSINGDRVYDEAIHNISYGFAWSSDSSSVFYTRVDDAWRPYQLWRHQLGSDPATDVLVYEEGDERFNIGLGRTRDEQVIIVTTSSSSTSETYYLPADDPESPLTLLCPRESGIEHFVEHVTLENGTQWWLKATNRDGAVNFRLDASPHTNEGVHWTTVIPHRPEIHLGGIDAFSSFLVISERQDGDTQLRVVDLAGTERLDSDNLIQNGWLITSDERPQSTWIGENAENSTRILRVCQSSMIKPHLVAQIDLDSRAITVLKQQEIPGGFNPDDYVTYRTWATSHDGVKVPISVVHRRALLASDGVAGDPPRTPAPCLLYGYGAYEMSMDPSFSTTRMSLLERGVIYAIAHVRGGGELGRHWYDDGHLSAKQNTFSDFIAAADHLHALGVTAPSQLVARGGSAGGLLIGAVANQGPDRFCALIGEVPFVDALNTMLDPSLPLTVGEYEEWGNPTDDPVAYATIKAYAPYENMVRTDSEGRLFRYPAMLLTAGLNDTRVGYWEPAKFTARLRSLNPENPVLLRTEMDVGHGGPSGRYSAWREEAFVLAWMFDQFTITE